MQKTSQIREELRALRELRHNDTRKQTNMKSFIDIEDDRWGCASSKWEAEESWFQILWNLAVRIFVSVYYVASTLRREMEELGGQNHRETCSGEDPTEIARRLRVARCTVDRGHELLWGGISLFSSSFLFQALSFFACIFYWRNSHCLLLWDMGAPPAKTLGLFHAFFATKNFWL